MATGESGNTLIFGATGYVGRHLVARLSASGDAVTGFARDPAGAAKVVAAGASAMLGSLQDEDAIRGALDAHQRIIWAAQLMLEPEHEFVGKLLEWLRGSGKAFIMTSGTGVLSERTDGDWSENCFTEAEAFEPRPALKLRVATEDLVRGASGLRGMVIRPPAIWGSGGSPLIAEIYRSIERTGAACYLGRGLNCYSNVHVEDLAELYAAALERGVAGALYHAVSGELNFRGLAEAVGTHMGVATRSLSYAEGREVWGASSVGIMFAASSRSRSPRARAELGWTPSRFDIHEECGHPAYTRASGGGPASWVKQ